jgi:hypothetical protein
VTNLSPSAQAIYDAFNRIGLYNEPSFDTDRKALAAALRAAADQTNPKLHIEDIYYQHRLYVAGWKDALDVILAIAAEMETSTTENR